MERWNSLKTRVKSPQDTPRHPSFRHADHRCRDETDSLPVSEHSIRYIALEARLRFEVRVVKAWGLKVHVHIHVHLLGGWYMICRHTAYTRSVHVHARMHIHTQYTVLHVTLVYVYTVRACTIVCSVLKKWDELDWGNIEVWRTSSGKSWWDPVLIPS